MTALLLAALFPLLMIAAACADVLTMRIPNRLNLLIAGLFPPVALAAGLPWETLGLHAGAGAAMLAAGYGLFAAGLIGGGDAKLMAAAALWLGWPGLVPFLAAMAAAGGVLALLVLLRRALDGRHSAPDGDGEAGGGVPYGAAIAFGAIHAHAAGSWMGAALP